MSNQITSDRVQSLSDRRLRVRHACQPCKDRKKRCNGALPCNTCHRLGYDCSYPAKLENSLKFISSDTNSTNVAQATRRRALGGTDAREANSSKALLQQVERTLAHSGHTDESSTLVEAIPEFGASAHGKVTDLIAYEHMQTASTKFFSTVHQVYGFLRKSSFEHAVSARWTQDGACKQDVLFCYVAALGFLFAAGHVDEQQQHLVQYANSLLEHDLSFNVPNVIHVASSALKTIYQRCVALPHAAWIASCTTVHLLDTMHKRHDKDVNNIIDLINLELIVQLQNFWISNENGKPHVGTLELDLANAKDNVVGKTPLRTLFQISTILEPNADHTPSDFEKCLLQAAGFNSNEPAIRLSQTNLVLILHRRLKAMDPVLYRQTIEKVLSTIVNGLDAATWLASAGHPWWHVANVPFQCICAILVMDRPEALSRLPEALITLEAVSKAFPSKSVHTAYQKARSLVNKALQRKENDIILLKNAIGHSNEYGDTAFDATMHLTLDGTAEQAWWSEFDAQMDQFINLNWLAPDTTGDELMQASSSLL